MLLEFVHAALSLAGTPPGAWRHIPDAVGLWARGRRQASAWRPHLVRTRAAILAGMPQTRGRVLVLGSGPLLDVPLSALCQAFGEVVLVDRIHLYSARLRGGPNVRFLSRDLSRGLAGLPPADWAISVNLLSQMALAAPDGEEPRLIETHLSDLASIAGRASLITDTSFSVLDRPGRVLERVDLLYGRTMPAPAERWDWEVAPFGEAGADRRTVHSVAAWPDWTAASLHAP